MSGIEFPWSRQVEINLLGGDPQIFQINDKVILSLDGTEILSEY